MASIRHAFLFGLIAAAAMPAAAQSGWATLVEHEATGDTDHLALDVPNQNRAMQIMLCVDGHVIQVQSLSVRGRGGATQNITVRARVPAGGCSRIMDLHGSDRDIAGVTVTYQPASLQGGTAQVQVLTR